MPGFDAIIGQRLPIRLLHQFIQNGMIPHALLFTGIAGIGKRTTAKTFAMALNCHENEPAGGAHKEEMNTAHRPCGRCAACRQISKDNHPDIITLKPEKAYLRIDQIRSLLGTLAMKPFNAVHRVVIIEQAETLTTEAGNALLKVLEEPPANTILLVIAPQKSDLIATIVSRCRCIHFQPLTPQQIRILLKRELNIEGDQAGVIAELAGGSFEKARMLASEKWQSLREWLIRALAVVLPSAAASPTIAPPLIWAAQIAQRRDTAEELLDLLSTWLRDLSVLPYAGDRLINGDRRELATRESARLGAQRLGTMWTAVQQAQKDIAANANLRLTLDIMALRMAGFSAGDSALK